MQPCKNLAKSSRNHVAIGAFSFTQAMIYDVKVKICLQIRSNIGFNINTTGISTGIPVPYKYMY